MTKNKTKRLTRTRHPERNRRRFGILLLGITLLALGVFVIRFFYISTGGKVDSANLAKERAKQYTTSQTLKAKRGTIYASDGTIIAEDASTYKIYAALNHTYVDGDKKNYVVDKDKTATVLAKYLAMSKAAILKVLDQPGLDQVEFGTAGANLSLALKQQIEKEKLPGIGFYDSPSRLYPNGVFASHVVGLAQATSSDTNKQLTGVMGLEKSFNNILKGTNGWRRTQTDTYGYELPQAKVKAKAAVDGGSVTTTLDAGMQSYLETLMTSVQNKYQPKTMTAVLMNAKTGAILAASQRPTFDPSTGSGLSSMWRDILVEDGYEPGSVMKIFTMAAAIESGTYHPNELYKSGSVTVQGSKISDWQLGGWGNIPLSQAFPRSSNVGMVKIEQEMGATTWNTYLQKFGFAQKTGIPLPGETAGNYAVKTPLEQAITSFGQGIDVNALQMMQGVTAIANKGTMIQPRIVSKTVSPPGKTTTYDRTVLGQPISSETASEVIDLMRQVVTADYGTGGAYKMPGVDLAIKTGTAQIASPKGGYLTGTNNYIFSVMGLAPASNPKYELYITMKQPQKMTAAAETILASIFKPMMTRALALDDNSTTTTSGKTVSVKAVTNDSLTAAQKVLGDQQLKVALVGTGNRVVQQLPAAGSQALAGARVILLTNGAMTMPDVSGWSKSDVLKLAQLTGKKFNLSGDGYATHQSLAKGSLLTDDAVTVTFKNQ
ncbi:penicillin-binding protein [Lacticaseibacillus mingshuiensis]|uniref:Penicillin-binding protein n=1 Tax=Lacticaseibacillus mingshuiensis TaxID=2799574 RepID=A0ABW4CJ45_9LACO|nr:penicillin-binding protein [Lacticaseibacillus mingshuiensis]